MKVNVLKEFKDTHTGKLVKHGEIEMTPERYEEAVANLSKWDGPFLEAVPDPGTEPPVPDPE